MKTRLLLPVALAALLPNLASADTLLGVFAGVEQWQPDIDGDFRGDGTTIDLQQDTDLDDDRFTSLYVALEHPIPLIPNFKVQRHSFESSGNAGLAFCSACIDGAIDLDLTHSDYIAYYEVLDNWVNLDLGINVKQFDGSADLHSVAGLFDQNFDIDDTMPMLYGRAQFDLPLTGLSAGITTSMTNFDNNQATDANAYLAWESDWGLGLSAGYRVLDLELEDFGDLDQGNFKLDGYYASLFFHF